MSGAIDEYPPVQEKKEKRKGESALV
jgi:hypothetical protein